MVATNNPPMMVMAIGPQNTLPASGIMPRMAASAVSTTGRARRTVASMMKKKGFLKPGSPDESDLWGALDAGTMPPPDAKTKLTASEKELIKKWIAGGAK